MHFNRMISLLVLLFGMECHATGWWTPSNLPVVILRMDDVVVRSCEGMAMAAIDAVLAKNTPINVGVIGSDLDLVTHASFVAYLRDIASNSLVEIFSHSYSHQDYAEHDLYWQIDDMTAAQNILKSEIGVLARTFSPPVNSFDSDTLEAMLSVEYLEIFSSKCQWNKEIPGEVIDCDSPAAVEAPNVLRGNVFHLPAGAVLGGNSYWSNKIQPGNLSDAIAWIDTQIANQNFSVVLLNPYEFSTTTECVTLDNDKIELLESLIDYGVGKYQFMTFQQAAIYFTNNTKLFEIEEEADAKFGFQARFNLLVVFCLSGCVFLTACLSFFRTSTEQKIQKKDRIAAELRRKKDIDSKLRNQRIQRNIELKSSQRNPNVTNDKKIKHSDYSKL